MHFAMDVHTVPIHLNCNLDAMQTYEREKKYTIAIAEREREIENKNKTWNECLVKVVPIPILQ